MGDKEVLGDLFQSQHPLNYEVPFIIIVIFLFDLVIITIFVYFDTIWAIFAIKMINQYLQFIDVGLFKMWVFDSLLWAHKNP